LTDATTSTRIDPVCGMTVELADAQAAGHVTEHEGQTYAFCGRGCLLDFKDDPATYLDPTYTPSM
jgi:YHS domain-containing protein